MNRKEQLIEAMSNELSTVESLVTSLPLNAPTESLDRKIASVIESADSCSEDSASRGRMWPAFVATALAASLVGFVAGQFVDVRSSNGAGSEQTAVALGPEKRENLTSVSFNLDAFKLLHGHSDATETDSCKNCHVGTENETPKWFHGWYYGDKRFFEKHTGKSFKQKCSACHKLGSPSADPAGTAGSSSGFDRFEMNDCSSCHDVAGNVERKIDANRG